MRNRSAIIFVIILFGCLGMIYSNVKQFEYRHAESDAVSWNGINLYDARALSTGDLSFFYSPANSGAVNPANLVLTSKFALAFSYGTVTYDTFQYWGVNEGVMQTEEPVENRYNGLSGITLAMKFKGFSFSIGWNRSAVLDFPDFEFRYEYDFGQYYAYSGAFEGQREQFHFVSKFELNDRLALGVKLAYQKGSRSYNTDDYNSFYRLVGDQYVLMDYNIYTEEEINQDSFGLTVGAQYKLSGNMTVSAAVVVPLTAENEVRVHRSFTNKTLNINHSINDSFTDPYDLPARFILGAKKTFPVSRGNGRNTRLDVGVEGEYILWESYKYQLSGEEIDRNLKNVFVLRAGMEYAVMGTKWDLYLRTGIKIDPQPVIDSDSKFTSFCFGGGIRWKRFLLDAGLSYISGDTGGVSRKSIIGILTLGVLVNGRQK